MTTSRIAASLGLLVTTAFAPHDAHAGAKMDRFVAFTMRRGPIEKRIQLIAEAPTPEKALALFAKTPEVRGALRSMGIDKMQILHRLEHPGGTFLRPGLSRIERAVYMTQSGGLHLRQDDVHADMGGGLDLWKDTKIHSDKKVRLGLIGNNFSAVRESIYGSPDAPTFTPAQLANLAENVLAEAAAKSAGKGQ